MGYTLERFAKEVHDALKAEPGPNGRKKVCDIVQTVLKDQAFVARHVGDDLTWAKASYELSRAIGDPPTKLALLSDAVRVFDPLVREHVVNNPAVGHVELQLLDHRNAVRHLER